MAWSKTCSTRSVSYRRSSSHWEGAVPSSEIPATACLVAETIYQSLRRRRERLESRLRELEVLQRGGQTARALGMTDECR